MGPVKRPCRPQACSGGSTVKLRIRIGLHRAPEERRPCTQRSQIMRISHGQEYGLSRHSYIRPQGLMQHNGFIEGTGWVNEGNADSEDEMDAVWPAVRKVVGALGIAGLRVLTGARHCWAVPCRVVSFLGGGQIQPSSGSDRPLAQRCPMRGRGASRSWSVCIQVGSLERLSSFGKAARHVASYYGFEPDDHQRRGTCASGEGPRTVGMS